MQTNVRDLKAQLSQFLRQVEAGATVTVRAHNRPVAEIVPIRKKRSVNQLATESGIAWNGGKPAGVTKPEPMPKGVHIADWVIADRQ